MWAKHQEIGTSCVETTGVSSPKRGELREGDELSRRERSPGKGRFVKQGGSFFTTPHPRRAPSRAAPSSPGLRKLAAGTGSDPKSRLEWERNGYLHPRQQNNNNKNNIK